MDLGRYLARTLPPAAVVVLDGGIGTGKTCLAKGLIAEAAGVLPESVTSPAYTLVNEYTSGRRVAHLDFYRLDALDAVDVELLEEYLIDPKGLAVVEWGSKFIAEFTSDYLQVELDLSEEGDDVRNIVVVPHGAALGWVDFDPLAPLR